MDTQDSASTKLKLLSTPKGTRPPLRRGQIAASLLSVISVTNMLIGLWALLTHVPVTADDSRHFVHFAFKPDFELVVSEMP